jgi:hypothetical protein
MKKTNTYLSNDCTRRVVLYVDENGHYEVLRQFVTDNGHLLDLKPLKRKHFHTAERACKKWIA